MAVARHRVALQPTAAEQDPAWNPAANPALTALLDHLAGELAHEYVRLMEQAAQDDPAESTASGREGS